MFRLTLSSSPTHETHTQGVTSLQLHTGNTRLLVGCEGPTTYDLNLTRLFERTGETASLIGKQTHIWLTDYLLNPHPPITTYRPNAHAHAEWSVHNNDQLSGLPFFPLLHRAYEGGSNRCNLKRAQARYSSGRIEPSRSIVTPRSRTHPSTPTPNIHSAPRTAGTSCAGATTGAATCGTRTAAPSSAASTACGRPPCSATPPHTRGRSSPRPSRARGRTRSWPSPRTWRRLSTPTWRRRAGARCWLGARTGTGMSRCCCRTWSSWTTRWRRRRARRSAAACLWMRYVPMECVASSVQQCCWAFST